MAKTNITQYSSTPSSNTDINNINIDENCPASGLNNAIRELMAHLKNVDTGSQALTALSVTGNLLVGTTSTLSMGSSTTAGFQVGGDFRGVRTDGNPIMYLKQQSTDGTFINFYKDTTSVGSIGVESSKPYFSNGGNFAIRLDNNTLTPANPNGTASDYAENLGSSSARWADLYLGGGVYLGGTGSANKLDDYEEGTWTPQAFSNTTQITTSSANGFYTVVGNRVFINGAVSRADSGSFTGNFYIKNLPFTPASNTSNWSMTGAMWFDKASATDVTAFSFLQNGVNQIYAKEVNTSNYVTADNLENSRPVYFSATYMKA